MAFPSVKRSGKVAMFILDCDWSTSHLGRPENWSPPLANTINLILASDTPMYLFWGEQLTCFCNDAYLDGPGYGGLSSIGKNAEAAWGNMWPEIQPAIKSVITAGAPTSRNNLLLRDSSNSTSVNRLWTFNFSAVTDKEGEIVGVLVICMPCMEETDVRAQLAIESGNLGTYEINLVTDEIKVSERFTAIWGGDYTKLSRRGFAEFIHPDDREIRRKAHKEAANSGKLFYEARVVWKDGTVHWLRVSGTVIFDQAKKPITLIGVIQDITEQKIIQQRKDNFIAMASHELKTPLTSLMGYAHILRDMLDDGSPRPETEVINRLDRQLNVLGRLVNDLSTISRIDRGRFDHNRVLFVFDDLLLEVKDDLQRTASGHLLTLSISGRALVFADRDRIAQVLINLISNAIKYSPGAETVHITLQVSDEEVIFCVEDFGLGIPHGEQELIFVQFYRVNTELHQSFPGMGLGLYISDIIVKKEGGKLWVESIPGKGSKFYFSLPLAKVNIDSST